MKETKEQHRMWTEYQKMSKEFTEKIPPLIGRWHYHYENKNGIIGLVRLNDMMLTNWGGRKHSDHYYEACGILDFERFRTKKLAEIAIYKALKEKYPK